MSPQIIHTPSESIRWKSFLARFIFPTVLTIALFLTSFFAIIIPTIEKNSIDRKKEMIKELTVSAWNILLKYEHDEQKGLLTRGQAQRLAIDQISNLHYGREMKDYFWINDMHPRMIMHPYRTDLNGKDLSTYKDTEGKRVFVEFVKLVNKWGEGYVEYRWQWKDDEERVLPKISYVKGFTPWGWIIGTGIYIDDVKAEIAILKRNLFEISLFILVVITLLLGSIIKQSYASLQDQRRAEMALRDSEEKYRTLVESAAEGMLMVLEGTLMYANQTIANLLEYSPEDLSQMKMNEIFAESQDYPGGHSVQEFFEGKTLQARFETRLKTRSNVLRDVIISTTPISIGGKNGFMAVITDITNRKRAEDALGESEEKFRTLANNINVGIFRRTIGVGSRFIEMNPAIVKLLGYSNKEELLGITINDIIDNTEDRNNFERKVQLGSLRREVIRLRRKDGTNFAASIWGVLVNDDDGNPQYFDGIVEDITEIIIKEEQRDKLFSEMQTALMFFNQKLGDLPGGDVVSCPQEMAIKDAAALMERNNTDVLLVKDDSEADCGMLTDRDMRKTMTDAGLRPDSPVSAIMSSPVLSLPHQSCIFESWLFMKKNDISHLFVTDSGGRINRVVHGDDMVSIHKYSPALLLWQIQYAGSPDEIIRHNTILPFLLTMLINSGAKPQNINHLTTLVTDTLLQRFIEFAINELGQPPSKFVFLVLGSEGRQEQTLKTDQDNAILFEDVSAEQEEAVRAYFLRMGEKVCSWLDKAGYSLCKGNTMAMNPQWCQSLTTWKGYFRHWICTATGEDLMRTKIFFDFRCGYGERMFVDILREHIDLVISNNPRFFQLFVRDVLPVNPPIGFLGNFIVESVGDNRKAFDIKSAMLPIVNYARIYAMKNRIWETNTLERLNGLLEKKILSPQNHQEMVQAYNYLMQMRLRAQAEAVTQGKRDPDNYVNPKSLTYIEQKLLKEIFSQIKYFLSRMGYDFTGMMGGAQ